MFNSPTRNAKGQESDVSLAAGPVQPPSGTGVDAVSLNTMARTAAREPVPRSTVSTVRSRT